METVVSVALTGKFPVLRHGTTLETRGLYEVSKRGGSPFFGWNRSPQQAESLAAAVRPARPM